MPVAKNERQRIALTRPSLTKYAAPKEAEHCPRTVLRQHTCFADGRRIKHQPHILNTIRPRPDDLGRSRRAMRVGDRSAIEFQADLGSTGVEVDRCYIEADGDRRTAGSKEQVANYGGTLELRNIRRETGAGTPSRDCAFQTAPVVST